MRLFIYVDDTLVKSQESTSQEQHPYCYYVSTPCTANEPLIEGIKQWRADHKENLIVIWSGGGRDYAQMWIDRLLPGLGIVGMGKSSELAETIVSSQGIVVDDVIDFPCAAEILDPVDWPTSSGY